MQEISAQQRHDCFTALEVGLVAMGFLNSIVTSIAPIFIATSPITSYGDQIYAIHKTRTSAGFSLDIPLIMLVSSILKVFYWFGAKFNTSLLVQALLMIVVHILLLHVALTHRPPPNTHAPFAHAAASPQRPYNFWQWRATRPYWSFIAYLFGILLVLHVLLSSSSLFIPYTNVLGSVGLVIEALLPMPQLLTNYRRKGCKGFRVSVIANWVVGDTFKMWFFFASGTGEGGVPWAFKVCGCFQALCDLGLAVQFWIWGDGPEGSVEHGPGYGHGALKGHQSPPVVEMEMDSMAAVAGLPMAGSEGPHRRTSVGVQQKPQGL